MAGKVLALAGGTGGAKLALGLARVLPPHRLVIVVNTGDDECFHGLHVSPDLDTIMYTLSGLVNQETGWGISGDTYNALEMLRRYQTTEAWFNLGDRDLATHLRRTQLLKQGLNLSQVTEKLCRWLGIDHPVVPMTDQPVRTVLSTDAGEMPMQTYFVRHRSQPRICRISYQGVESAEVSAGFADALNGADLIIFGPSNPYLSIGPILAVPGVKEMLQKTSSPKIAVSPIVGGAAIKGPAAKIMAELGDEVSCVGLARLYQEICNVLVIDEQDAHLAPEIQGLGMQPLITPTIMNTEADKIALARRILQLKGI